ncbi:MAG: hypothetical protein H7Y00_14285, partial [Fimbriimonadaceae bacterium]|nr:hypothetical protein [Chitinophagales bacterium]
MTKFLHKLLTAGVFFTLIAFLSNPIQAQYCIPDYTIGTSDDDYIDGVELEDISNFSGPGDDWNDFTDLSTTLNPGLEYTMTVYNTPVWGEYYQAWIDYNQDDVFDDDEKLSGTNIYVFAGSSDEITFTVPFTAFPGTTTLRVMCIYDSYEFDDIDPCHEGIYTFGETEDYSIVIPPSGPYDVGAIDIISLSSGCGLTTQDVTVEIINFGTEIAESGTFEVSYTGTGPSGPLSIVTETYTGADIASLGSVEFTFSTPIDLSEIGDYFIEVYTIYDLDGEPLNDGSDIDIVSIPIVASFPYYEDFEDGGSGWLADGTSSSWELGSPASFIINTPPDATPLSVNSWKTDLDGDFNYGENSYVVGPCFDFTTLEQPYVELDYWVETYEFYGYDGARLEYSLDAGGTWESVNYLIGADAEAENWYNDGCYSFDPFTFPYDSAWTRTSGGWKTAHYNMSGLAGESQVQLRIHFASSFFTGYDGFAFDNFRIQDPYDNDLEMTALVTPESMPSLSATETVTVNVTNVGLNDQSAFSVFYQIGAGAPQVQAYTGDPISYGESADITFLTSPADLSADGDYDFKIWISLGPDEYHLNDTLYATVSNLLPITGDAAYYLYSNVYGGAEPWSTTTNSEAMDAVFGTGEWATEFYETLDPLTVFGLGTCFIFMEGGDAMADELETFLENNESAVQNWVASGGHLFLNAAPNEGDGMDFLFGDVSLNYSWFTGTAEATDAAHPIFNYYFTPTGTSWTGSSFGHATVSGGDITPLIHDFYNPDKYLLAEKEWGGGRVIFGGMTPNFFHSPALEAANLRASIIQYQATCTLADIDLGVLGITDPDDGCDLGLTTVSIKIANYGFLDQVDIPVNYRVDGGVVYTEFYSDTIASGDIADFTFFTPYPLSTGPHIIEAWTGMVGDLIVANDSTDKEVNSYPIVSSFPYYQDFETGPSSWFTGGTNSTWELGDPAGSVIIGAPDATPLSVNSWTTELDDSYDVNEESYLQGPCFDFSTLILPYIEFDLWMATADFWDGMQLQYSLDGAASWTVVDYATGEDYENWYTGPCYAFGYDPITFAYDTAWEGSSGGWVHAMHDVTALAGEPNVQFRFKFSTAGFLFGYDGMAIDNINIQDPYPHDIGVTSIETPSGASVEYTSTETVSVMVENFGTLPQDEFDVSYRVDGGTIVTQSYAGVTLNPGDEVLFTFTTTTSALTADGIHDICAWTELESDEDLSNDSTCIDIINVTPVSGSGAYLLYSNITGWEPFYGYEYGNAMDDVFGSGSWTLDYYEVLDPMEVFSEDNCFIYMAGGGDHGLEISNFLDN